MINIYTDGSYRESVDPTIAGWSFVVEENEYIGSGIIHKPLSRNIDGEVEAAKQAIQYAIDNLDDDITIHHDYEGVGAWAEGRWKAKKLIPALYVKFLNENKSKFKHNISFSWTKGHNGDYMNELADEYAKNAVLEYKNIDKFL